MFSFNYMCLLLVARAGSVPEGEGWVEFMQNQNSLFLAGSSSLPSLLTEVSLPWCPEATLVLQPPPVRQEWLQMSTLGNGEGAHSVICLSPAVSFLPLSRPVFVLLAWFFSFPTPAVSAQALNLSRQGLLLCEWCWSCCPVEGSGNAAVTQLQMDSGDKMAQHQPYLC